MFGSEEEKKELHKRYHGECDFQVQLKQQRFNEERRREDMEIDRNQTLFQKQMEEQRLRDLQKKEQMRRVAEENVMMAQNRKNQEIKHHVEENMKNDAAIHSSKITYSTMIRWCLTFSWLTTFKIYTDN